MHSLDGASTSASVEEPEKISLIWGQGEEILYLGRWEGEKEFFVATVIFHCSEKIHSSDDKRWWERGRAGLEWLESGTLKYCPVSFLFQFFFNKKTILFISSTRRPSFLKDFRHYVRCDNISSTYLCLWFAVKILFLKLFFDGFISCIDLYLFWNWVFGSYIYWSLRDCRLCVFSLQFYFQTRQREASQSLCNPFWESAILAEAATNNICNIRFSWTLPLWSPQVLWGNWV